MSPFEPRTESDPLDAPCPAPYPADWSDAIWEADPDGSAYEALYLGGADYEILDDEDEMDPDEIGDEDDEEDYDYDLAYGDEEEEED